MHITRPRSSGSGLRSRRLSQPCRAATVQQGRTYPIRARQSYSVHVRNSERGSWATLVRRVRGEMTRSAFARQAGVDRATVIRWEESRTVPTDAGIIRAFAESVNVSEDEALRAAGYLPTEPEPGGPADPDERVRQFHLERAALIEEIRRAALRLAAIDGELAPEPRNERRTV